MNDPASAPPDGGFLRGMVMAIGLLIMGGSGLCSAGFLISMISDVFDDGTSDAFGNLATTLGMVAVWGGVPFLFGWLIWRSARGNRA